MTIREYLDKILNKASSFHPLLDSVLTSIETQNSNIHQDIKWDLHVLTEEVKANTDAVNNLNEDLKTMFEMQQLKLERYIDNKQITNTNNK